MEDQEHSRAVHALWVHHQRRVFSFQKIKGFQEIRFPTHAEMFRYAVGLTESGYRVR